MVQVNAKIEINLMLEPSIVKIQHLDLWYGHGQALETYFKDLWTLFEHFWTIFYYSRPFEGFHNVKHNLIVFFT
jgi:hypothetical protein